jgi:hypothetical protein
VESEAPGAEINRPLGRQKIKIAEKDTFLDNLKNRPTIGVCFI